MQKEESKVNLPRPLENVLLDSLEHMAKYIVRTTIIHQSNSKKFDAQELQ